jgi:catechol 2,3-dioxygenase-like lactoylglutathione lyase family enzyme
MNLNQVTVPSSDVARSIEFYRRLGLILIVEDLPNYARFECPEGESTFSVEKRSGASSENGPVVYFECEDLDATVVRLKVAGVLFDSDPHNQRWLWREARLKDPDGNCICLFKAGTNRKSPPWRIQK